MQSLQQVRKNYQSIGFGSNLKSQNLNILTIHLVSSSTAIILLWMFLFSETDGAHSFIESVHIATVGSCIYVGFVADILVRERLFSFFDRLDGFLDESKLKSDTFLSLLCNKFYPLINIHKIRI